MKVAVAHFWAGARTKNTRSGNARDDKRFEMPPSSKPTPPVIESLFHQADEFTRREPAKAVVSAFGFGILLNLLPVGAIAAALVGIAFSLVRPALLFFGLLKACECCRTNDQTTA